MEGEEGNVEFYNHQTVYRLQDRVTEVERVIRIKCKEYWNECSYELITHVYTLFQECLDDIHSIKEYIYRLLTLHIISAEDCKSLKKIKQKAESLQFFLENLETENQMIFHIAKQPFPASLRNTPASNQKKGKMSKDSTIQFSLVIFCKSVSGYNDVYNNPEITVDAYNYSIDKVDKIERTEVRINDISVSEESEYPFIDLTITCNSLVTSKLQPNQLQFNLNYNDISFKTQLSAPYIIMSNPSSQEMSAAKIFINLSLDQMKNLPAQDQLTYLFNEIQSILNEKTPSSIQAARKNPQGYPNGNRFNWGVVYDDYISIALIYYNFIEMNNPKNKHMMFKDVMQQMIDHYLYLAKEISSLRDKQENCIVRALWFEGLISIIPFNCAISASKSWINSEFENTAIITYMILRDKEAPSFYWVENGVKTKVEADTLKSNILKKKDGYIFNSHRNQAIKISSTELWKELQKVQSINEVSRGKLLEEIN